MARKTLVSCINVGIADKRASWLSISDFVPPQGISLACPLGLAGKRSESSRKIAAWLVIKEV